jgi:hypothetical protein
VEVRVYVIDARGLAAKDGMRKADSYLRARPAQALLCHPFKE